MRVASGLRSVRTATAATSLSLAPHIEATGARSYDERPLNCAVYRCELLRRLEAGELDDERAFRLVAEVRARAAELRQALGAERKPLLTACDALVARTESLDERLRHGELRMRVGHLLARHPQALRRTRHRGHALGRQGVLAPDPGDARVPIEQIMSVSEAAKTLRITRSAVIKAAQTGRIKGKKSRSGGAEATATGGAAASAPASGGAALARAVAVGSAVAAAVGAGASFPEPIPRFDAPGWEGQPLPPYAARAAPGPVPEYTPSRTRVAVRALLQLEQRAATPPQLPPFSRRSPRHW